MKIVVSQMNALGQEFVMTLECADMNQQQNDDLSYDNAEGRIFNVLKRELNRSVEVFTVAQKDAELARKQAAEHSKLKAAGKLPQKGPAQIVGAGTKDQASRLVEQKGRDGMVRMVPASESKKDKE
jgi:hypothetical protein